MATLNGQQISATYEGLIKTANNQAGAPFPPAKLQYGDGTELPISIGDGTGVGIGDIVTIASGTRTIDLNSQNLSLVGLTNVDGSGGTAAIQNGTFNFGNPFQTTNVDFTNATVTGLPGGAAGLESGTGTDSMQSAASLTTNAADASGNQSIALGDGATASSEGGVAIGESTVADGIDSVAIGRGANSNGESVAIGDGSTNAVQRSVAIGRSATANQNGIAIGNFAENTGVRSISMASCAVNTQTNAADDSVMIVPGSYGTRVNAAADGSITIGGANSDLTRQTANAANGIAIGFDTVADASGAVALGSGVTAATADTVSVKALETQTNSTPTAGGIIISDASGTDQRLNVTSDGNLQLGTTRMGIVGWSTSKVSETQATSSCDTTRASVLIPAGTVKAGDILQIKSLEQRSGSSGFTYSNLAIHTAGTIGQSQAGAFVSGHQNSSDGFGAHSKNLFVQTVDGTGDGTIYLEDNYTPQEKDGGIFSANLGSFTAIDWTVDQYLCVNVCIDNSGTTWTNYGASLTIIGRN